MSDCKITEATFLSDSSQADGLPASKINRRTLLKSAGAGLLGYALASSGMRLLLPRAGADAAVVTAADDGDIAASENLDFVKSYELAYADDLFLSTEDLIVATALKTRLEALRGVVGYGQFNLISFDLARRYGAQYHNIGRFSVAETAFLEELFYRDAADLGFKSERVVARLTHSIAAGKVSKVGDFGNYLYRGAPQKLFRKIRRDVGANLQLTSGIRGVVKQAYIYLDKVIACGGNLSMASRSIAPPAYSYHAIGDFDVGQAGYGQGNFSSRFLETDVYRRLQDLSYVENRYAERNLLGVRYEPWHVKVA